MKERDQATALFNRDRSRKRLSNLLSKAMDEEAFVTLLWAVHALQTDRPKAAARHLKSFPVCSTNHPTFPRHGVILDAFR